MTARLEQAQQALQQAQDALDGFHSGYTDHDRMRALCDALEALARVTCHLVQEATLAEIGRRSRDEREHNRSYTESRWR